MTDRIVLVCSADLDVPAALSRLGNGTAEVVALALDLGAARELDDVRGRALAAGAVRAHVLDVRDEFARDYLLPAVQAGALRGAPDLAERALALPLVAKTALEVARIEGATTVAHAFAGRDAQRFEASARALDPSVRLVAVDGATGPAAAATRWGATPDGPARVRLLFDAGVPVALNGVDMTLTELIDCLATIAGREGVEVLQLAHGALEEAVVPADVARRKIGVGAEYADLIRDGLWFTAARASLDGFTRAVQETVSGHVDLRLFKGTITVEHQTHLVERPAPEGVA